MQHRITLLLAGVAAAALIASCDEGRIVTEVEAGPFEPALAPISGPDTLVVGEAHTFSTEVTLGDARVTAGVVRWSITPPSRMARGVEELADTLRATAVSPGQVTVTARVEHADLAPLEEQHPLTIVLLNVAASAPADGDTLIAALDDRITLRGRGLGEGNVAADTARLVWTRTGSATTPLTPLSGVDTLTLEASAPGTDVIVVSHPQCIAICQDTIRVVVQPAPTTMDAPESVELRTLGRTAKPVVVPRDRNGNVVAGAVVGWTLVGEGDAQVVSLAADGTITAVGNGTATVAATSGAAAAQIAVTVDQTIHAVDLPATLALGAIGSEATVELAAVDSAGAAVSRPHEVAWTVRDEAVVAATPAAASATVQALAAGSTWVVAETEGRRDSVQVTVSQVAATVQIDAPAVTIDALDGTLQLTAEVVDGGGAPIEGAAVAWSSDAGGTATVSSAGLVTGHAVGSATITATSGDATDAVVVEVRQVATIVEADADTVDLDAFDATHALGGVATDANGNVIPDAILTWTIAEPGEPAAISLSGGTVTALANGTARVVGAADAAADTVVIVMHQVVDSLQVAPASLSFDALDLADTLAVTAFDPLGSQIARALSITWFGTGAATAAQRQLADPSKAEVTAEGAGPPSVVYVGAEIEGLRDSASVTVIQVVDSVAISPAADTLNALGHTLDLAATPLDRTGHAVAGKTVTFASLKADSATVDPTTGLVTATGIGSVPVTATVDGVSDTAVIVVRQVAESVTVSPATPESPLFSGDTVHLTVAVADSNARAMPVSAAAWSSSDPAVAKVMVEGDHAVVTAQTVGGPSAAWIRAVSGPASDSVQVQVDAPTVSAVTVSPDGGTISAFGGTLQLSATAFNQNSSPMEGETFSWSSSDETVATVGSTGLVTAQLKNGSATITASSASDPSKQDAVTVTVQQAVASVTIEPADWTFHALTRTKAFAAKGFDARGHEVAGATFSWSDPLESTGVLSGDDGSGSAKTVTADQVGSTLLIVASADVANLADTATVEVEQVPGSITVTPPAATIAVGGTTTITAAVADSASQPIPSGNVTVTWTSADTDTATVGATTGMVTGVAAGLAQIIASVPHPDDPDGSLRDTSSITVASYVLSFDGGDYVDAGDVLPLSAAWTIEAWVKPAVTTGTQFLISRGGTTMNNDAAYGLYLEGNKPAVFTSQGTGNASKDTELISGTGLTAGQWSHVAASYDGTTLRIYLNGAAVGSVATANAPQINVASLIFGASSNVAGNPLSGRLDELRFWNVARDPADILDTYRSRLQGTETGLVAYWRVDEGTGATTAIDEVDGLVAALGAGANAPTWVAETPIIP